MEIPVLIEPVANNGFRALSSEPWRLQSEAPTREEAIGKLRELIEQRVADAEFVSLTIGRTGHSPACLETIRCLAIGRMR